MRILLLIWLYDITGMKFYSPQNRLIEIVQKYLVVIRLKARLLKLTEARGLDSVSNEVYRLSLKACHTKGVLNIMLGIWPTKST